MAVGRRKKKWESMTITTDHRLCSLSISARRERKREREGEEVEGDIKLQLALEVETQPTLVPVDLSVIYTLDAAGIIIIIKLCCQHTEMHFEKNSHLSQMKQLNEVLKSSQHSLTDGLLLVFFNRCVQIRLILLA